MSEESAREEGELVMHKHTPEYRSEGIDMYRQSPVNYVLHDCFAGLTRLLEKLDQSYKKNTTKQPSASFNAFPRVVRSPAKRPNAPSWAIRQDYQLVSDTQ